MIWRKLANRSLAELADRGRQTLLAQGEFLGHASGLRSLKRGEDTRALVSANSPSSPEQLLAEFRRRERPFFKGVEITRFDLDAAFPDEAARLLDRSADIQARRFDLLGYSELDFGARPRWNFDPVSGRSAPQVHWTRVPYLDADRIGDHKVIWELNRHQFLVTLGQAFRVTRDEAYVAEIERLVEAWIEDNPPGLGINWASSLEVAFRAISWTWALHLIRDSRTLDAGLYRRMLTMLALHAQHVHRYLSTYFSPNTHLTGEALGLIYVGSFFPELRGARAWRSEGWRILESSIPRQVSPDGVYFEQSTHYQRYTIDFLIHAGIIASLTGGRANPRLISSLEQLLKVMVYLQRPDGLMPQIGDEDGGRLVQLDGLRVDDCRGMFSTAALILKDPILAEAAGALGVESAWLLGSSAARDFGMIGRAVPVQRSAVFAAGGLFSARTDWSSGATHLVMDCGPHGAMSFGHSHTDALSIQLSANGIPLLVDGGTYTYVDRAERDYFRSAKAHSMPLLGTLEPSVPNRMFSWASHTDAILTDWEIGTDHSYASAHYRLNGGPEATGVDRHVRFLQEGVVLVVDSVAGSSGHSLSSGFHLAPGISATWSGDSLVLYAQGRATLIIASLDPLTGFDAERAPGWTSSIYGRKERCENWSIRSPNAQSRLLLIPVGKNEECDARSLADRLNRVRKAMRSILTQRPLPRPGS
jgi:hypothetical protein